MAINQTERYNIWSNMFLIVPIIVLTKLSEVLAGSFTGKVLLSVLIGAIAGLAGHIVYSKVKRTENFEKALALALLACVCLLILFTTETLLSGDLLAHY